MIFTGYEKKKYKTFLTPFVVLFFPTVIIIFINNVIHPFEFYEINHFGQTTILITEILFILPSLFLKNKKLPKINLFFSKWIYYICIITLFALVLRLLYELNIVGGLKNFELLKEDRKNNIFSNFVEFFSVFMPVLFILKNKKNKFLFILFIFFQLLFQNKNRVFILILQTLYLKDICSKIKIKIILKYLISIIGIFFIIYNLKGFSQVGFSLDLKSHNLAILKHIYYYLTSPIINIQNLYNDFSKSKGWYYLLPIIGIIKKLGIDLDINELELKFYDVGENKFSNVGSIFGEVMFVSSNLFIYLLFFILLSLFSYSIFKKRKKSFYYSILSSFLLAALSLSFFSNIFNLLFIWKRIVIVLLFIIFNKFSKIIKKRGIE